MTERLTLVRERIDDISKLPGVPGYMFYPALDQDIPGIVALLNESFPGRSFTPEWVKLNIIRPFYSYCTFIALELGPAGTGTKVIATASARKRFKMGEVAWVACDPEHRGKGISTALVQHALVYLRHFGIHSACAVLAPPTEVSLKFWKALSFTSERPDLV